MVTKLLLFCPDGRQGDQFAERKAVFGISGGTPPIVAGCRRKNDPRAQGGSYFSLAQKTTKKSDADRQRLRRPPRECRRRQAAARGGHTAEPYEK